MKRQISVLGTLYFFFMQGAYCGETSQQMQQLHKEIGNGLIDIKKINPELQQTVYSLLDQVGALHKLSGKIIQKRKKIKAALEEEQDAKATLHAENEALKTQLKELQNSLGHETAKTSYYQQQCDELAKERIDLMTRRAELESKERESQSRIKELEKNIPKASTESASVLHKPKEINKVMHPLRDKNASILPSQKINV